MRHRHSKEFKNLLTAIHSTAEMLAQLPSVDKCRQWNDWKELRRFYRNSVEPSTKEFAIETALALTLKLIEALKDNVRNRHKLNDIFSWYLKDLEEISEAGLLELIISSERFLENKELNVSPPDFFSHLFSECIHTSSRRALGQFQTSSELSDEVISIVKKYLPNPFDKYTFLDPSCGTGSFIWSLAKQGCSVTGFDIDPLCVLASKLSYCLTHSKTNEIPVFWIDSLLLKQQKALLETSMLDQLKLSKECRLQLDEQQTDALTLGQFDCIIGNPPWVNWANLSHQYRETTKSLWYETGLVKKGGYNLLLGTSRADIAHLFTHHSAEVFLKDGGILAFLLPLSAIRGTGASDNFRNFHLASGIPMQVLEMHDLKSVKPFSDAIGDAAILIARKGEKTKYPVVYVEWQAKESEGSYSKSSRLATVVEDISSMVVVDESKDFEKILPMLGASSYNARQGVNTCGANDAFFFEAAKCPQIESGFLFPLLRSSDVQRWNAQPTMKILFPYSEESLPEPISSGELKQIGERTFAYLKSNKLKLANRKSAVIRPMIEKGYYYAMYGVGRYCFAKWKVVWRSFGVSQLNAAVVSNVDGKPILANQALHSYIALNEEDEAHYIAGVMNSFPFAQCIQAVSKGGIKSFAQPGLLKRVRIPKYNIEYNVHKRVSQLAKEIQLNSMIGKDVIIEEKELNRIVIEIWKL